MKNLIPKGNKRIGFISLIVFMLLPGFIAIYQSCQRDDGGTKTASSDVQLTPANFRKIVAIRAGEPDAGILRKWSQDIVLYLDSSIRPKALERAIEFSKALAISSSIEMHITSDINRADINAIFYSDLDYPTSIQRIVTTFKNVIPKTPDRQVVAENIHQENDSAKCVNSHIVSGNGGELIFAVGFIAESLPQSMEVACMESIFASIIGMRGYAPGLDSVKGSNAKLSGLTDLDKLVLERLYRSDVKSGMSATEFKRF